MGSWKDWWKLARLEHSFFVAFAVLAAQALAAKSAGVPFSISAASVFAVLGPFLITAAAFILNDFCDVESDRHNKRRERPLVAGKIAPASALRASLSLYALGLLLSLFVNPLAFAIAFAFALLSVAYDVWLKRLPLVGHFYIAGSMGASFLYGNAVLTPPSFAPLILLFVAISFLAGVGRELLITLRDVKGDRRQGLTTLPMMVGAKNTVGLSSVLFISAVFLSWLPALDHAGPLYLLLMAVNNLLVLYTIFLVARSQEARVLKRVRNLTLAALGVGILMFASLAL